MTAFFFLAACGPAPSGAVLLVPEDLRVQWADSLDDDDGVGALFWLEAEVLDADGAPAAGAGVEVTSGWRGTFPASVEDVHEHEDEGCAPPCTLWTDEAGRAWELRREPGPGWRDEDPPPGYLAGNTDSDGRFPFVLFMDSAPDSGAASPVFVSIAVETDSFEIVVHEPVVESN